MNLPRNIRTGTTPCEARAIPLHEKRMRACGLTPTALFEGRHLCAKHENVQERRAAARGT